MQNTCIYSHITMRHNKLTALWGITLFFLISALNIHAQEGVQQRFFTSQNGLKISWVNSITKSQDNIFTMGHGAVFYLSRYDGYDFDFLPTPPIILGKVYEDSSGSLWGMGPANLSNVSFFSNNEWENLEFDAGIPFLPTPGKANRLLFIRDGALQEFDKTNQQTRIIKRSEKSQIGRLIDMTVFQDGSVWITGEVGVAKYLAQCDTCDSQEVWIDFQVPKAQGLYHFTKPFEGENGELTLLSKSSKSTKNVLVGFDGKVWQKLYTSQTDEVYYGWRGHDNSLWIIKGSLPLLNGPLTDWNLFHVQQDQETPVIKNRILNRVLNDVIVEPNGAFWLATGSGLAYFAPTLWRRQTAKVNIDQRVKKIHEDLSGRLWFAMENDFSVFSNGKWKLYQSVNDIFTGDICSLRNGLVVVGATELGGLALFNPIDKSFSVTFPFGNEKIRFYNQDKNGNCFIILQDKDGTSRLVRYDGEHVEKLAENLKIDRLAPGECEVTDIIQTREGDIWIVTFTDIIVYKKGIRKSFDLKKEFGWGLSTSILEFENGNIWISGSAGILQYDGDNWSRIQAPEFETARMMTITSDSSIWVASGTGVHRYINGTWISNSKEEGLPNSVIFDIHEDNQGKIWATTENGVYCYYPEADTNSPETVVPKDMNSHEAVPSGEMQFVLEGHDKWDNTPDNLLQYSYRIDENSWTPFENKTTVLVGGLSAGPHIFEVRAMDRNGLIDPTPAVWPFTVLLPWYKEIYFIILLTIAILLIILSLAFAVTRHLRIEKLVKIRTAELEKTKEKAEESDRLKSAFLANMSHEIRTPMNGILGFAELLKKPGLTGEQQQSYIRIIEKGGARMLNIINDIISISKIESGEMEVEIEESNINDQIEYIYTFFKPEVEAKGMKLSYKNTLPAKEAIIKTDREKLFSILTNLVKNAIKYSDKGAIEFGYDQIESQGIAFLRFYVKDTGIGIPKDRQEAIFERFIQADIEDKMARQGAGLGLSISKAYVEKLGGKIWVESEENVGSTFYFTIPYNVVPMNSIITENIILSDINEANIAKLKILIVEDDPTSEMLLAISVSAFAKETIAVETGNEAVEACRNNPDIDLVLMDIQLPDLNGYEATRQIRKFNTEVIIIAQTAFSLSGDREKALEAGCNDYISKPIKKDELLSLIRKYFMEY